jgi:hypothetical protein
MPKQPCHRQFILWSCYGKSSAGRSARPDLDGKVLDISQQSRIPLLRVLFLVVRSGTRGRCATAMAAKSGSASVPSSPDGCRWFGRRGKPSSPCCRPAAGAGRRPGTDCSNAGSKATSSISRRSLLSQGRTRAEAQRLSLSIERQSEWSFASRSYFVRALLRSLRRTRPVIAARDKGRRAR